MKSIKHLKRGGFFSQASRAVASFVGQPAAFGLATGTIIIWASLGPMFNFSDTWQLVINTSTTIITFLMVFLIDLEELTDRELSHIRRAYSILAHKGRTSLREGLSDTDAPDVLLTVFDKKSADQQSP